MLPVFLYPEFPSGVPSVGVGWDAAAADGLVLVYQNGSNILCLLEWQATLPVHRREHYLVQSSVSERLHSLLFSKHLNIFFFGNCILILWQHSFKHPISFLFFLKKLINFWLRWVFVAARGLSLVAASGGLLSIVVRGLLIAVASLVAEHGLQVCGLGSCGSRALERRLSSCGARAQLLHGTWDLPRPGLEPVSAALAGRFLTTVPPGQPLFYLFFKLYWSIAD